MTESCPPSTQLLRLLAGELTRGEEEALEAHVTDCSECQCWLEQITRVKLTLPDGPAGTGEDLVDATLPVCIIERVAKIPPNQIRLLAQQYMPQHESEAAWASQTPEPESQRTNPGLPDGMNEHGRPDRADDCPWFLGRYEVRSLLGSGGGSWVYLAHDRQLDRPIAIKIFRGGTEAPSAEGGALLQEARRLAQLRHPAIMAIHDVVVHEGRVCVVSEFLDGPHLGEWLRNNRPSWQDAARITATVADALAHAHARLIVHRDVKPRNIILTAGRTPVLVDFGHSMDEACADSREKGAPSGTPAYLSPEQVAGLAHRIDGRTDIYSLGVVLYEMLCGHVPFRSNDLGELLGQIYDDEPQPPRQLVPDLPPSWSMSV